jgi:hypothetical protein
MYLESHSQVVASSRKLLDAVLQKSMQQTPLCMGLEWGGAKAPLKDSIGAVSMSRMGKGR